MTTADELELESDLPTTVNKINVLLKAAKAPDPEVEYEAAELPEASTLGELLEEYEYGEPLWNGSLMLLAKYLLVDTPTTITVSSIEDLTPVDSEYISYFHHGDVVVNGDFDVFESVWITGNLSVTGVIEAGFLDAFPDLMVGGNVSCRAIMFMGLSLIAGELSVERLAYVQSQGENWILGGIKGPMLIGEWDSVADFDQTAVQKCFDLENEEIGDVASLLGLEVEEDDEHAFSLVFRAMDEVRVAADE